jgi:hypothetical protein
MSNEQAAIVEFLRTRGATRCPTAFAVPTMSTPCPADVAQLRRYHERHEAARAQIEPRVRALGTTAANATKQPPRHRPGSKAQDAAVIDERRVREALAGSGWTLRMLAQHIGVSLSTLSRVLNWQSLLRQDAAKRLQAWANQPPLLASSSPAVVGPGVSPRAYESGTDAYS